MEVTLTPNQEALVRQALKSGRLSNAEQAAQEAFSLWEKRERNRGELIAALDQAESDLAAGRYADYSDDALPQLADDLKREGRALRDRNLS